MWEVLGMMRKQLGVQFDWGADDVEEQLRGGAGKNTGCIPMAV